MTRRGIIIANTGSPDAPTPEAVRTYLRSFLTDPRIAPMPPFLWNIILKAFILPKRSVASAEKYRMIWTEAGSPLAVLMRSLATKLQAAFASVGDEETIVRCAMSYGTPSMDEVIAQLKAAGCEELSIIPLYPQSAHSTTLVVRDKALSALAHHEWQPMLQLIESYSEREEYLDAIARSIVDAGFDGSRDQLLFAFHSIPMKDIEAGDTYDQQAARSATAIAGRLGLDENAWQLGFQCRFDKSRTWLGPFTGEAIDRLDACEGRLFVVAPNFSIDCLETLYDIEVELKERYLARDAANTAERFVYVPCLNDSDAQVELLRALVTA